MAADASTMRTNAPVASGPKPSATISASSRSAADGGAPTAPTTQAPQAGAGASPSVSGSCKGFETAGLKYSPGGSTLPDICSPFDGTRNNPYAIRCVDADASYKTAYLGDELCILPPPPELGTQIHLGPSDPASAGDFELRSGEEISDYYYINSSNMEPHFYYRSNWRMRPGGHHMLIAMLDQDQNDGWTARGDMGSDFGGRGKSFGGAQRPSVDRPQGVLEIPPENAGLGQQLGARQQFSFNLHHINSSATAVLREVWINIWYIDEKQVTQPIQTFAATGNPADVAVPAGQQVRLEYQCTPTGDTRIISLYGHYHAHGKRFGIAVARASGDKQSVYESFDWADIPVYQYDSGSTNPPPDVAIKRDGASSGLLTLGSDDALHFECNIENDSNRALRFADEAVTGEMCIMFGAYTGAAPCTTPQRVR